MSTSMKRDRLAILLVSVFFVLTNWSAFAKKAQPALVQQEEGYYYGYGKGATAAEAERAGKRDLVESALTAAVRSVNPKASRIQVSDASVKARINDIKPYVQSKKNEPPAVTYRMKIVDWDKKEKEPRGQSFGSPRGPREIGRRRRNGSAFRRTRRYGTAFAQSRSVVHRCRKKPRLYVFDARRHRQCKDEIFGKGCGRFG